MSNISDKIIFTKEIPLHLRELGLLLGRTVQKTELLPLKETEEIRARANQVIRQPVSKFIIPFEAKREQRFMTFLKQLSVANHSDVYFWTPASNRCGVLRPLPLEKFCVTFPFELNPEGIVVILTSDLCDQLLLDYSLGDDDGEPGEPGTVFTIFTSQIRAKGTNELRGQANYDLSNTLGSVFQI